MPDATRSRDIRTTRLLVGITQFELAKRSGVERTRISLAENGHIELRKTELSALLRALISVTRGRASELQGLSQQMAELLAQFTREPKHRS